MSIIRKISTGIDFPNGAMHYQLGKTFTVQDEQWEVIRIAEELTKDGRIAYNIYIQGADTTVLWKSLVGMPVHIEYDINFG